MKSIILFTLILIVITYKFSWGQEKSPLATKDDIQLILREMDKRFEQIDKRLNFLENLSLVIITGLIVSPFIIEYLARRRNEIDRKKLEEAYKSVLVLKELSKYDPKIKKAMKSVGLE
ncbi:MAG: hypothetical protein KatS3mg129_3003 [Leptospiraceae bacterium]|nr:MAG: hypothetical protein KatS3mg129_3003 [Leptospiraceae bacterium]